MFGRVSYGKKAKWPRGSAQTDSHQPMQWEGCTQLSGLSVGFADKKKKKKTKTEGKKGKKQRNKERKERKEKKKEREKEKKKVRR